MKNVISINSFIYLFSVLIFFAPNVRAGVESMREMPLIQPKKIFVVPDQKSGEALRSNQGFGDNEPSVRMKNLMMVEGSGMEGMDMGAVHAPIKNNAALQPSVNLWNIDAKLEGKSARVGFNIIDVTVLDAKTKKPVPRLKLKAQVRMMTMDMGVELPEVREISTGKYQLKAAFSMQGSWSLKVSTDDGSEKEFIFQAAAQK